MKGILVRTGVRICVSLLAGLPLFLSFGCRAETLEDALAQAYSTNPQLAAARRRLREVDESVPKALTGWRPTVTISGSIGASALEDTFDTVHLPERRLPQTSGLTVTQPVYTGGRVPAQLAQSEALVRAERSNLLAAESTVLLAAATAYLDVARDQKIVALNASHVAVRERTEHASNQERAVGALTDADLAQVRARLADARAAAASAEAQLARSRSVYEQVVGSPPGALDIPAPNLHLPSNRDVAVGDAEAHNFTVVAARDAFDAAEHGVDAARAGSLPQVALRGVVERDKATALQQLIQRDNVAELDMVLTVPLYRAGQTEVETRTAREVAARGRLQIDVAIRQARQQAMAAWDQLQTARTRVEQQRASIDANQIAVRGVTLQQKAGARTLLEVLNAQDELLGAKVNLSIAERDEQDAALQLAAAVGKLSAAELALPVKLFDPLDHYNEVRDRWFGAEASPP